MSSNNNYVEPNAKEAMKQFKMETAREVGVNLKEGYNGDLTSREAGSVGGQMVKKNCPIRTTKFLRIDRNAKGHQITVTYITTLTI